MPKGAEFQMVRDIGSSILLFCLSTAVDVEALFDAWSADLETAGYRMRPQPAELGGAVIEVSGHGLSSAKIPTEGGGGDHRSLIRFDATLRKYGRSGLRIDD